MTRSTSAKIMKPYKEQSSDWKPKKVSEPDVGTYEPTKAITLVKSCKPKYAFPKSKCLKFTVEFSNTKKHIPGAGNYNVEKCYDKINRPYLKKRY